MSRVENENFSRPKKPVGVYIASFILLAEALVLLGLAIWSVRDLFVHKPFSYSGAIFLTVLLLAFAVGIATVGHFLFRGYRWTRSAALVIQIFIAVIGLTAIQNRELVLTLVILIPAILSIVLLFTRPLVSYVSRTTRPNPPVI